MNDAAAWAGTLGKLEQIRIGLGPEVMITQVYLAGYHDNVPTHWRTSGFTAKINQNCDVEDIDAEGNVIEAIEPCVRTADGETIPL